LRASLRWFFCRRFSCFRFSRLSFAIVVFLFLEAKRASLATAPRVTMEG
jgi:hypothetical protein